MKKAVAYPYREQRNKLGKQEMVKPDGNGKRDVHDIGKNIVSVVLACNNYEIVDLGVMVPPNYCSCDRTQCGYYRIERINYASLDEMVVSKNWIKKGLNSIMIGGATTSRAHTAVKLHRNIEKR
jgi:5-methyltetrahydrofolate--homocysteine methyltransferase